MRLSTEENADTIVLDRVKREEDNRPRFYSRKRGKSENY